MIFRCHVNEQDAASFVRHCHTYSPVARKQIRQTTLWVSLVVITFFVISEGMLNKDWQSVVIMIILYLLLIHAFRRLYQWWTIRYTVKMIKLGLGCIGDHEFELDNGVFIERANGVETRTAFDRLHAVCETDSHVFVYLYPLMGHIIPKQDLSSEELAALLGMKELGFKQSN